MYGVASFFPDDWKHEQILEEIAFARSRVKPSDWFLEVGKTRSNSYKVKMSTETDEIIMYIGSQLSSPPQSITGRTISSFPK